MPCWLPLLDNQLYKERFSVERTNTWNCFKSCIDDIGNLERVRPHLPQLLAKANQILKSNNLEEAKDYKEVG